MTPTTIPQAQVDAAMSMLAHYGVPEDKARIALYAAHSAKVPDQSEDKMMSEMKLLPCPFCGGEAELVDDKKAESPWIVNCSTCDINSPHSPEPDEAVAAWNRRAVNSHEALVAALERAEAWFSARVSGLPADDSARQRLADIRATLSQARA